MPLLKKVITATKNIHFQSLLGNGITAVLGLLILSILYRTLSINDIGKYAFFLVILSFVDTFRSGFLTSAFIKFYSGTEKTRANEIMGSAWCLALLITAGLVVLNTGVTFFSAYIKDVGVLFFLKYFIWVFLATLPFFMASIGVQGDKRFDRLFWLKVSNQLLYAASVVVLISTKKATLDHVLLAYIFSNLAASLFAVFRGWAKISAIKHLSKKGIAELFHFGKYSLGTNLTSNLFRVTDIFFINFLGPAAIAIYYLGGRLLQIIEMPLSSLVASSMPVLSSYYNSGKKEEMMDFLKKMTGIVTVILTLIALVSVVFANPIIGLIGGGKYLHTIAPNVFRLFMSVAVLYAADRFFAVGVDVIHKPNINFYKILVMLVINVVIDYVAITLFKSVYSVVVGNIFPTIAAIIITYIPLNKYSQFSFWGIFVSGYKECVMLIKKTWGTLTGSNKHLVKSDTVE